jgi:large subunit ribosomal protein L4
MVIDLLDNEGKKVSELALNKDIYEGDVNEHLFYEVVKMQLANRRAGTACTKTRSEVSGGGAKPWRQKGTGRARAGTNRSPLWRHGGTTFGPKPRDYSYHVPRRVRKDAIKSALRLKLKENRLKIFDSIEFDEPKTKKALEFLKKSNLESALVIVDGESRNLQLAFRNLKGFKCLKADGINVYDILKYDDLVMTKSAFEKIEALLR